MRWIRWFCRAENKNIYLFSKQKIKKRKTEICVEKTKLKFEDYQKTKIALSAFDDKRIESSDSIETYAYDTSKGLICKKEEIKSNKIIKQYKND